VSGLTTGTGLTPTSTLSVTGEGLTAPHGLTNVGGAAPPPVSSVVLSDVSHGATLIISNGALTATAGSAVAYQPGRSIDAGLVGSGFKYYWTSVFGTLAAAGSSSTGVGNASFVFANGNYLGINNNSIGWFDDGTVIRNNVTIATYGIPAVGDVLGTAIWGGNKLWFSRNGVWQSGDPNTLTGGIDISTLGDVYPAYNVTYNGSVASAVTFAFGSVFVQPAPTGFTYLP
jgi:hypothetical protein